MLTDEDKVKYKECLNCKHFNAGDVLSYKSRCEQASMVDNGCWSDYFPRCKHDPELEDLRELKTSIKTKENDNE